MKPLSFFGLPGLLGSAALLAVATVAWSVVAPTTPVVLDTNGSAATFDSAPLLVARAAPALGTSASVPGAPTGMVALSPETTRLEQRRILYETVDALVQASEFERARKLLDEEQERDGDELAPEWRDLAQGYRLMADCLEKPSPKHRARGEAFLLVNEAQSLNGKLRAACSPR